MLLAVASSYLEGQDPSRDLIQGTRWLLSPTWILWSANLQRDLMTSRPLEALARLESGGPWCEGVWPPSFHLPSSPALSLGLEERIPSSLDLPNKSLACSSALVRPGMKVGGPPGRWADLLTFVVMPSLSHLTTIEFVSSSSTTFGRWEDTAFARLDRCSTRPVSIGSLSAKPNCPTGGSSAS